MLGLVPAERVQKQLRQTAPRGDADRGREAGRQERGHGADVVSAARHRPARRERAVSRVALAMPLDGDADALAAYLAGDRHGVLVAPYYERLGLGALLRAWRPARS